MDDADPPARTLSILGEEGVRVAGGALDWVPVRRRLGVEAFGVNAYRAATAGDMVIEPHVESPGQQELYVVLTGAAEFTVAGATYRCPAGEALFVADPEHERAATALEDGTAVLAVGGWRERPYHPLPWEPIYLAQEAMAAGEWGAAAEILEREAGPSRESPFLRYRLACCLAQAGDPRRAVDELRLAIAGNGALGERAAGDEQLASLRAQAGWAELVG